MIKSRKTWLGLEIKMIFFYLSKTKHNEFELKSHIFTNLTIYLTIYLIKAKQKRNEIM